MKTHDQDDVIELHDMPEDFDLLAAITSLDTADAVYEGLIDKLATDFEGAHMLPVVAGVTRFYAFMLAASTVDTDAAEIWLEQARETSERFRAQSVGMGEE